MNPYILAAAALLLFSTSSASAQLSPESDTVAPSLELRTNAVVSFNAQP